MRETDYKREAHIILHSALQRHLIGGAVIGILDQDHQHVFNIGTPLPLNGLFETGSVTKVFTAFLLASLVSTNTLSLDDELCRFLPPGICPSSLAHPIRLIDLATHTSGLPLLPDDVGRMKRRIDDPYSGYTFDDLYRYLARSSLEQSQPPSFLYSNLGYALLARVMSIATAASYPELLTQRVFKPLGMSSTLPDIPGPGSPPLLPGHTMLGRPAIAWQSDVFAGCGGICSTVPDLLRFLKVCIAPPPALKPVVETTLQPRLQTISKYGPVSIALSWKIDESSGWCWHDGVTGGHSAYIAFHPASRRGIVVLTDRYDVDLISDFARRMQNVMEGLPAIPMTGVYELPQSLAIQAVIEFVQMPFWLRSGLAAAASAPVLYELLRMFAK